jgi:hypothetical protein
VLLRRFLRAGKGVEAGEAVTSGERNEVSEK